MRRLTVLASALLLGASLALVPSPASAAPDQFGNTCQATAAPPDATFVMTAGSPSNPIPATAPSTGVITKATFSMPGVSSSFPQTIKILRATGAPNQYTVIAQSVPLPAGSGIQSFDVRLPVNAGDLLGLYGGATGTLACNTANPADTIGSLGGDAPVGSSPTFAPSGSIALPVIATVEPDVDRDGFGDLTQDQCPQSASIQGVCPVVVLDSFAAAQGGKVVVVVATDNSAKVQVTGKAKVNGKTVKLKSRAKTVTPGKLGRFKLRLSKALRDALSALPPSKSITIKLVATSTDLVGRKAKDKTKVKLPGTR